MLKDKTSQTKSLHKTMLRPDYEIRKKNDMLHNVDMHHHDFYEIYFLLSGRVTYSIESRLYQVMPGDLLFISPRELHQLFIEPEQESYERYVLWVDPDWLSGLSTPNTDLGHCFDTGRPGYGNLLRLDSAQRAKALSLLETLYEESLREDFGSDILRNDLLAEFMIFLNRTALKEPQPGEYLTRSSKIVSEVVRYINLHYGEPLSLDLLADRFFVSKYHLSHEFNRQTGTSIGQYIQKKRLLFARRLLAQGKKPSEVSLSCGFGDYTGFYRAFKAEYGTSPREYTQSVHQKN